MCVWIPPFSAPIFAALVNATDLQVVPLGYIVVESLNRVQGTNRSSQAQSFCSVASQFTTMKLVVRIENNIYVLLLCAISLEARATVPANA